jgi:hypothetical protein
MLERLRALIRRFRAAYRRALVKSKTEEHREWMAMW